MRYSMRGECGARGVARKKRCRETGGVFQIRSDVVLGYAFPTSPEFPVYSMFSRYSSDFFFSFPLTSNFHSHVSLSFLPFLSSSVEKDEGIARKWQCVSIMNGEEE